MHVMASSLPPPCGISGLSIQARDPCCLPHVAKASAACPGMGPLLLTVVVAQAGTEGSGHHMGRCSMRGYTTTSAPEAHGVFSGIF